MTLFDGRFTLNDIFDLLAFGGLIYYLIKRFILKQPPVPSSAFKKADKQKLKDCLALLNKYGKIPGKTYIMPEELEQELLLNLHDPELLRQLLKSITTHMGIEGDLIKLQLQDDATLEYAGQISSKGAYTTIKLQIHDYYNLDVLTAVLAHEVMHLYLYYNGIAFPDTPSNEILTDTAAVYFGFGEYLYRGYKIIEVNLGFSYHKVGYIRPEDVQFIQNEIRMGNENNC